jgi:hypothetical protein
MTAIDQDRATGRTVGAVVSLAAGVFLLVAVAVSFAVGTLPDDGTQWFVLAMAVAFMATAGLDVSRPAPDRLSRTIRRVATIGVPAALVAAALLMWVQ